MSSALSLWQRNSSQKDRISIFAKEINRIYAPLRGMDIKTQFDNIYAELNKIDLQGLPPDVRNAFYIYLECADKMRCTKNNPDEYAANLTKYLNAENALERQMNRYLK